MASLNLFLTSMSFLGVRYSFICSEKYMTENAPQQMRTAYSSLFTLSSFLIFLTIQNNIAKPTTSAQFKTMNIMAFVSFIPHGMSSIVIPKSCLTPVLEG